VAMDDVANKVDFAKWVMSHMVRGTKPKNKICRGTKFKKREDENSNLKTLVLPSSSCLSSSIFNGDV